MVMMMMMIMIMINFKSRRSKRNASQQQILFCIQINRAWFHGRQHNSMQKQLTIVGSNYIANSS